MLAEALPAAARPLEQFDTTAFPVVVVAAGCALVQAMPLDAE